MAFKKDIEMIDKFLADRRSDAENENNKKKADET